MHLSGALYVGRNSKPGKKVDKAALKPNSGGSSTIAVSGQNNASDGSGQPSETWPGPVTPNHTLPDVFSRQRHNSVARASEPFVTTSPGRESAPLLKPTKPSSRRKDSSPRVASEVMGRGGTHSIGDPSGVPSDVVRTGSDSPRRSSLFSPEPKAEPALADDEGDVTGR